MELSNRTCLYSFYIGKSEDADLRAIQHQDEGYNKTVEIAHSNSSKIIDAAERFLINSFKNAHLPVIFENKNEGGGGNPNADKLYVSLRFNFNSIDELNDTDEDNLIFESILLKENNQEESAISRREFFKKTARKVLPMVGLVIASSIPFSSSAFDTSPQYCNGNCTGLCTSCTGGCKGACKGCQGSCENGCQTTCGNGCGRGCQGGCQQTCKEECVYECQVGCSLECSGSCGSGCSSSCFTGCKDSCRSTCSGNCRGDCTGTCRGTCGINCSSGCSGASWGAVYNPF